MTDRVLLVGLGAIGMGYDLELGDEFVYSHARAVSRHPAFALVGAVDPDENRRLTFERAYGRPAYAGLAEALQQQRPEVVILATPTGTHATTLAALMATHVPRAVLCEKPLAPRVDEARAMLERCRADGVALYVNYIRRSAPGFLEVARRFADGQIQAPVKGTMWYSKGLLHNGSHLLNLLQAWLGPVLDAEILDPGRTVGDGDAEPDARINFSRGAIVALSAPEERFSHLTLELIAANGRLRVEQGGFRIEWQPAVPDPGFPGYGVLSPEVETLPTGMERYQAHVVSELAAAMQGRPAALCPGHEALETMVSIQQILEKR